LRFDCSSEKLDAAQANLLEETLDADLAAIEEELEQLQPTPTAIKGKSNKPRRDPGGHPNSPTSGHPNSST